MYAATGAWHHLVITVTSADILNIWLDGSHDCVDVLVSNAMPSVGLDAGWCLAKPITNTGTLCSYPGSIQSFKLFNRILRETEVFDVM